MPKFNDRFTQHVITVCFKCENRHVGCHSDCEAYLQQKEEQEQLKAQENRGVRREMSVLSHRVKLLQAKKLIRKSRYKRP